MNAKKLVALVISIGLFLSANLYAADPGVITYAKSTQIVLNTSATGANVKGDLKDLPVLVKLNGSNFDFNAMKKDNMAGDLNFTISDGSSLSYYIQKVDKTTNVAEVWIIVPKVLGNNNSQFIKISYSKNMESITDQKMKERVEAKESQEISIATSGSSLFKSSYNVYGVWTSNNESGFSITGVQSGM